MTRRCPLRSFNPQIRLTKGFYRFRVQGLKAFMVSLGAGFRAERASGSGFCVRV